MFCKRRLMKNKITESPGKGMPGTGSQEPRLESPSQLPASTSSPPPAVGPQARRRGRPRAWEDRRDELLWRIGDLKAAKVSNRMIGKALGISEGLVRKLVEDNPDLIQKVRKNP